LHTELPMGKHPKRHARDSSDLVEVDHGGGALAQRSIFANDSHASEALSVGRSSGLLVQEALKRRSTRGLPPQVPESPEVSNCKEKKQLADGESPPKTLVEGFYRLQREFQAKEAESSSCKGKVAANIRIRAQAPAAVAADAGGKKRKAVPRKVAVHFETLRLPTTAGPDEVKRAFRRLALQFHPDKNPSAPAPWVAEEFRKVREAYQGLSLHFGFGA